METKLAFQLRSAGRMAVEAFACSTPLPRQGDNRGFLLAPSQSIQNIDPLAPARGIVLGVVLAIPVWIAAAFSLVL
jgi:hypothetical protein